ncbi:hypothetical protein [Nocardioides rubriscoriae]|uniref:hypothetical protein n=1 Tax=Nocardioides rubriscoriae TaxID=642762 RepID=UPI0011DFC3BE|nr:hypothetical protein [Nocardioides rubriscoriae]
MTARSARPISALTVVSDDTSLDPALADRIVLELLFEWCRDPHAVPPDTSQLMYALTVCCDGDAGTSRPLGLCGGCYATPA